MESISQIIVFDNLTIYSVEITDTGIRHDFFTSRGVRLEGLLDECSNELRLRLTCLSKLITVDFELSLSDVNFEGISADKQDRLDLRTITNGAGEFYSIRTDSKEELDNLRIVLLNLYEIYVVNKRAECHHQDVDCVMLETDTSDVCTAKEAQFDKGSFKKDRRVLQLCDQLQESIGIGNVENAIQFVYELANLRAKLEIKSKNVSEFVDDVVDLDNVIVFFKDKSYSYYLEIDTARILDIKEKILGELKVPIENQIIFVNDLIANNGDFLSEKLTATASNCIGNDIQIRARLFIVNKQSRVDKNTEVFTVNNKASSSSSCQISKTDEIPQEKESGYMALYNLALNEASEPFDCDICLEQQISPKQGVLLKECLHVFCKECLRNHINFNPDPVLVQCPYIKEYKCAFCIQDREIKAILSEQEYEKLQIRSLRQSEASMKNSVHCKSPDCIGFAICEDDRNNFECPVCEKVNCLRCDVIHMSLTCKEYQDNLKLSANNDEQAKKSMRTLEKMVADKTAMHCPQCNIILCKNKGCDAIVCPMCQVDICWATRGLRWGPNGKGDTTGGCRCDLKNGKPCVKGCLNCH